MTFKLAVTDRESGETWSSGEYPTQAKAVSTAKALEGPVLSVEVTGPKGHVYPTMGPGRGGRWILLVPSGKKMIAYTVSNIVQSWADKRQAAAVGKTLKGAMLLDCDTVKRIPLK